MEMTMEQMKENQEKALAVKQDTALGFTTGNAFAEIQRVGKMFSMSDMVPASYQGNIGNCTIATEIALRMKISPLMVMHNLNVIQGRPAWSSPFLIATFNSCGKFSALRYHLVDKEGNHVKPGAAAYGCYCSALEKSTGEELVGTLVSMDTAKAEGWTEKRGSKWKTMPEQMLRYRAAGWFIRAYAPELSMGLYAEDEVEDFADQEPKAREVKVIGEKPRKSAKPEPGPAPEPVQDAEVIEEPAKEEEDVKKKIETELQKKLREAIAEVAGEEEARQEELFRRANGGSAKYSMADIPSLTPTACQYLLTRIQQIADGEQ